MARAHRGREVTVYRAPLADMKFALDLCELPKLMSLPKFADIDSSVVGPVGRG
ncbi:MAG: hypothetical protein RL430_1616 [Actinomycetota bacterium]